MKTVKKNVYYCDHCKKKSLAAHVITKHEKNCTANPKRECGLCENKTDLTFAVNAYKSRFLLVENTQTFDLWQTADINIDEKIVTWIAAPITLEEIKDQYDYCPNCVLAILRQAGLNKHYFHFDYDYKKEFDLAAAERNRNQKEDYFDSL